MAGGGKRGPRARPTQLKVLEGARPSRINRNEPLPAPGEPEPPEDLDDAARAVWRETMAEMAPGVVARCDRDALTVYCQAVVLNRESYRLLRDSSLLVKGRRDGVVKNPALQPWRDTAQVIRAFAQEFGLTPSSRSGITLPEVPDAEAERLLS